MIPAVWGHVDVFFWGTESLQPAATGLSQMATSVDKPASGVGWGSGPLPSFPLLPSSTWTAWEASWTNGSLKGGDVFVRLLYNLISPASAVSHVHVCVHIGKPDSVVQ